MSGLPSLYLEVRGRERSVSVETPGLPMILRKSEMAAERCAVGMEQNQDNNGLSGHPHSRLPRATASLLLALAFHFQFPAFPIGLLGQQCSSGSLPAMLSCADPSPAQMGSDKANMEGQGRNVCNYSADLKCVRKRWADNLHRGSDI